MNKWILVTEELPQENKELLVAFVGWDDIIFQRTIEYDYENDEWSDWNGEVYENVIAWQQLPCTNNLKAW